MKCRFCEGDVSPTASKCKHCGEWIKRDSGTARPENDLETCGSCGKKIIPRVITGPPLIHAQHGWTPVPKKSICPFCGSTHKVFPPSTGERIGVVAFSVVFVVVVVFFLF